MNYKCRRGGCRVVCSIRISLHSQCIRLIRCDMDLINLFELLLIQFAPNADVIYYTDMLDVRRIVDGGALDWL